MGATSPARPVRAGLGRRDAPGSTRRKSTFDVPGSPTRRFRLINGDIDAETRGVLAIGVRDEHAIYRLAAERMQTGEELSDEAR
jgi:hypothetical protein